MIDYKFKIGDRVLYDGLVAVVEGRSTYYGTNNPCYDLVAEENPELTCTAAEEECELYNGKHIDQSDRLDQAKTESNLIALKVDRITDKNIQ